MANTYLLTGGSGTLSGAIVPLLQALPDTKLIKLYARNEHRLAEAVASHSKAGLPPVVPIIGDVQDVGQLHNACYGVTRIIHAAAMKRIEYAQKAPEEAIKVNIGGAIAIIHAAQRQGVEKCLFISSDKAVAAFNTYGKTKGLAEDLFVAQDHGRPSTFAVCRYGNVVGSQGSVVQAWLKAKQAVQPIRVTTGDVSRYWWGIHNAAAFCVQRLIDMQGGEIYIPRMLAAPIGALALAVVNGHPVQPAPPRPAEKAHELLASPDEYPWVRLHPQDYYIRFPLHLDPAELPFLPIDARDKACFSSGTAPQHTIRSLKEIAA